MAEKKVGRPPKYTSKEEIEGLIEKYFDDCNGKVLTTADGETVYDKYGHPVIVGIRPPTVTGLALALGFASRQALLNYQGRKEFNDTITRAKARIECYAEERLFDRDGVAGAKFSLMNNFEGWSDRQEVKVSGALETEKTKLDDLLKQMRGGG